jgi:hypothetical protein
VVANASKSASGSNSIEYEATCPASATIGEFVYVTGPAVSGVLQVATVDITDLATLPAFGIITDKATSTSCTVRVSGEFISTDTLTPGIRYFIGVDGKPSDTMPNPIVGGKAGVQAAAYALDTNKLLLTLDQIPIVRVG